MKKIILLAMMAISMACHAQMFEAPKKTQTVFTDTTTTFTYKTNKGEICKVFKTKKGAYYYYSAKNKTNTLRKYYVPKEIQIKMGRKYDK